MPTEPIPETKTKLVSRSSLIAIIIAIAAIIIGLQNFYSSMRDKINNYQQISSLQKNSVELRNDVDTLQNNKQMRAQRLLANITYLVHLANLNLTVEHNQATALKILLIAQQEILSSNDANLSTLKQALSSDIATIRAASDVNVNQLFSTLSTVNQQIQALSPIPTQSVVSLHETVNNMKLAGENLPWYDRALESLKQLKSLFVIRHLGQPSIPLLSADLEINLKQNMSTQINMAQWALLHRDQKVYQLALQNATQWLTQYFVLSTAKEPIIAQLTALEKMQIQIEPPAINKTLNALSKINSSGY